MSDQFGLLKKITNAVLDLQAANIQSYPEPLARLGRLLQHEDLQEINRALLDEVDLESFLEESRKTQGGMVGSAQLQWPDNDFEILGLKLALILRFSDQPDTVPSFGRTFYYSDSNKIMASVNNVTEQLIIPFLRDYREHIQSGPTKMIRLETPVSKKVFIVHGHDTAARETLARFLMKIGLDPIILNEQANKGRTIIEKIEANSEVGFAVVLLTPDDEGRKVETDAMELRARQNVLLELGYFLAHLGRDRVCALKKGEVTIPSDFAGVVWETMDDAEGWKMKLARELKAAGHTIDASRLID